MREKKVRPPGEGRPVFISAAAAVAAADHQGLLDPACFRVVWVQRRVLRLLRAELLPSTPVLEAALGVIREEVESRLAHTGDRSEPESELGIQLRRRRRDDAQYRSSDRQNDSRVQVREQEERKLGIGPLMNVNRREFMCIHVH